MARKFNIWGWLLFLVSAGFFIGASLRNGDLLSLLGGLFFFAACILFLVPVLRQH
ncbi:MAG: hypothetical protein QF893_00825 [Alphaproteobacteria bacterium]|jgi:hypothetical protein|nr:hypothetical protein [Alphaproteobacteria bacterium]